MNMVVSLETVDDDVLIVEGQLKSYTFFSESKRSEYKMSQKGESIFTSLSFNIETCDVQHTCSSFWPNYYLSGNRKEEWQRREKIVRLNQRNRVETQRNETFSSVVLLLLLRVLSLDFFDVMYCVSSIYLVILFLEERHAHESEATKPCQTLRNTAKSYQIKEEC